MGLWILKSLLLAAAVRGSVIPEVVFHKDGARFGHLGGVASESRECSIIGRDILARGGNAVDAMVATTFCVGVIASYHSGIGGGGFAVVRDAQGKYEAIDFRETAPAAAFEDMYEDNVNASIRGGLAVAVPSEIRGLEYMHSKYGVLPWSTVMQGAIHIARNGFQVSSDAVFFMNKTVGEGGKTYLIDDPTWAAVFAPQGRLPKEGEIIKRETFANTLEKIAKHGPEAFYSGAIAETLVDFIRETGGIMTLEDLKNYTVSTRPVKTINYRGLNLRSIGSPAGGAVGLQILKIMEHYKPISWDDPKLSIHRFTEAMRFAYGARTKLGDPPFVMDYDVEKLEVQMLSDERIKKIVGRISDFWSHDPSYYDPDKLFLPDNHGTSHIVAADASGLVVSLTTTVNLIFGAEIMEPKTGIILNNEMNDFSIPGVPNEFGFAPSEANFIRPGKRPLSSICPIIAEFPDGTFSIAIGAAGGSRIISATAQALWHILDHNMTAAESLAVPRMHDQLAPDQVLLEREFGSWVRDYLVRKRHKVDWAAPLLSAVQGIRRLSDGAFEAASEPRQKNSGGFTL